MKDGQAASERFGLLTSPRWLMEQVDAVIAAHGGWPGAFRG